MEWKEAFALPKSSVKAAKPPGTVEIVDGTEAERPKRGFIKFPTPSSDPRDPLNFASWRKIVALIVVSMYAFVANFTSAVIAPVLQLWPAAFPKDPRPYHELTPLIAVNVLFLGVSSIWWVPLSNWMGKRPVLLLSALVLTVCSIWAGFAGSYASLIAARIFQGLGGSTADTVAPALVGDLFFIHHRGRAMSVYTVLLCTGPLVGGLSGGYIGFRYGWSYVFWVSAALSGFCFVSVALLVPETLYERPPFSPDQPADDHDDSKGTEAIGVEESQPAVVGTLAFWQFLSFRSVRGSLWGHVLGPWRALYLPGTWVVMLHYAGLIGGVVTISMVGAQLVAMPPYLWGQNAGLINIGGIIGALLGYIYTHATSDGRLKRQAKRAQRGVSEAEDRLPTLFLPLAISTCGFFVFGFCAQYPGDHRWAGLEVGYGMLNFGLMQVPSVGFNYLIDSYQSLAADCFTMVTILRSLVSFAWTFCVAQWVEDRGAAEPFGIFGMLMGLFSLLTILLWRFGKRGRIMTAAKVELWR